MDKNARYSLVALGVLAAAAVVFGVASYTTKTLISASSNVISQSSDLSVPLKMGENSVTNGPRSIRKGSRVIAVNDNLSTIAEAQANGVIGSVQSSGKIFDKNIQEIGPNEKFSITALDGSKVVQFLPEAI